MSYTKPTKENYAGSDWIRDMLVRYDIEEMSPLGTTVADLLGDFGAGIYHFDRNDEVNWDGKNVVCCKFLWKTWSTFDFNELTRLVYLCYIYRLSVSIRPLSRRSFALYFTRSEVYDCTIETLMRWSLLHEYLTSNIYPGDNPSVLGEKVAELMGKVSSFIESENVGELDWRDETYIEYKGLLGMSEISFGALCRIVYWSHMTGVRVQISSHSHTRLDFLFYLNDGSNERKKMPTLEAAFGRLGKFYLGGNQNHETVS